MIIDKNLYETISRILEGKQVGVVYHFMPIVSFWNFINGEMASPYTLLAGKSNSISLTRNFTLPTRNVNFRNANVRLSIDGTKLSDSVKISPISGYANDHSDANFDLYANNKRMKRDKEEFEEVILGRKSLDVKSYIIQIDIAVPQKEYIENKDSYDMIIRKVIDDGISCNIINNFNPVKR